MLETLTKAPPDKILALMGEYAADSRLKKIDLGVGVYKDEKGATPILSAVQKAEERMLANGKTKTYLGIAGNKGFNTAVLDLILGGHAPAGRIRVAQSPGGTGALFVLLSVLHRANPAARVWLSDPTWPNHEPMVRGVGLRHGTYPYFDEQTRGVRFEQMLAALDHLGPADVVLLHACCHNPTGANLSNAQWDEVAASLARTGAFPLVDLAYLGFGDGIDEDAYGTRKVLATVPQAMVAFSGSKNFGLYRERIGAAILMARDDAEADIAFSNVLNVVRCAYSQPPDHGAEIIRTVLEDKALRAEWMAELDTMRARMIGLRAALAAEIRQRSNATDFDFIASHRGMFSLLGLPTEAVRRLKAEHAVYMLDDSRINVAGIPQDRVGVLAEALLSTAR